MLTHLTATLAQIDKWKLLAKFIIIIISNNSKTTRNNWLIEMLFQKNGHRTQKRWKNMPIIWFWVFCVNTRKLTLFYRVVAIVFFLQKHIFSHYVNLFQFGLSFLFQHPSVLNFTESSTVLVEGNNHLHSNVKKIDVDVACLTSIQNKKHISLTRKYRKISFTLCKSNTHVLGACVSVTIPSKTKRITAQCEVYDVIFYFKWDLKM